MPALRREPLTIAIDGLQVSVERKRIRNLYLRVHHVTGNISLTAPRWVANSVLQEFVAARLPWLRRQLERMPPAGTQLPLALAPAPPGRGERERLRTTVLGMMPAWESRLGVHCRGLHLRHMRSRWGSCNIRARTIRLNTELLRHPPDCLEYVLVHELVHLLEPSHNARFKALMDRFLPDWRARRALLRTG